jgi:hypothetical protein
MKLGFLALPEGERRLYLEQAAIRRNLSPVILEKDFWVCWLLGVLFESEFARTIWYSRAVRHFRRSSASLTAFRKISTCRCLLPS